ncbi:hypothetical protein Pcinc_010914 [Petrolisthes cinctipes]|uniref:Uncharacterized protein n=1 Tax=Petrolisthes cinctipes TaxID=88211 RepID=A0AAE1G403_PETCI|nr:hypothetical protein Pcinc_010914 [Petrolisthes cinctipes]
MYSLSSLPVLITSPELDSLGDHFQEQSFMVYLKVFWTTCKGSNGPGGDHDPYDDPTHGTLLGVILPAIVITSSMTCLACGHKHNHRIAEHLVHDDTVHEYGLCFLSD